MQTHGSEAIGLIDRDQRVLDCEAREVKVARVRLVTVRSSVDVRVRTGSNVRPIDHAAHASHDRRLDQAATVEPLPQTEADVDAVDREMEVRPVLRPGERIVVLGRSLCKVLVVQFGAQLVLCYP